MTKTKKLKLSKQLTKFQNKQHLQKPKNQGQNQNQGNNGQNQKAVLSKEDKEKERLKHAKDPYADNERTLLIGEGNFSFALALANNFVDSSNLYASSYDTEEELEAKYGDEVKNILEQLKEMDVNLLHSIDATNLQKSKKLILKAINERKGSEYQTRDDNRRNTNVAEFDKVVFNFPHAGRGIKSQVHNIKSNQNLLLGFFRSVPQFLSNSGQVLITLKSGEPYDSWKISSLATQCGFVLKECFPFNCKLYPGYEHRRTLGRLEKLVKGENDEIAHKKPKTYIFVLKGSQEVQKPAKQDAGQKRKKSEDDDDDDDNDEEKDDSEVGDDNF